MLTLRSSFVAFAIGVGTLPGQAPAHSSPMLLTPAYPDFRVVQQGDTVHLTERSGYYLRSLDGGRGWPLLPQWLPLTAVTDFACGSGYLIAAGFDGQPSGARVYRSTDGGVVWQGPVTIAPSTTYNANGDVRVYADGANVVCVWPGSTHMWARYSANGGMTWQVTPTQLSAGATPGTIMAMIGAGLSIHVFWRSLSGPTQYQQVSADGGLTWLPAPRVRPAGQRIARDGNDVYSANSGATLSQSHDGGVSWTSAPVPGMQTCLTVACAGQSVVVGGSSDLPSGFSYTLNVSTDGGTTWQNNPWTAGSVPGFTPIVHVTGDGLYAHFRTTSLMTDLLLHSNDLGVTWRVVQQGVDTFAPGPRRNIHVMRVPVGSNYYDAVFVGTGYTPRGTGLAGTGSIVPELRLGGLPHLGATTSFAIGSAAGGSLGVLGFAFAPPQGAPLGPATVWLQGPLVLATIVTNGAPGAPGAGSAALPVAIPVNPALVGSNLTSQALLLDAGAAAGFTVTNAIEVWMR